MKIFIAGPITGVPDYKQHFAAAEKRLRDAGHVTMNPATLAENEGFDHADYMHVCFAMLRVCKGIYLLEGWRESKGACMEFNYARQVKKIIAFEGDDVDG